MRQLSFLLLSMAGCAGTTEPVTDTTEPVTCGDCGVPTTCAEPFCDEESGACDPGYLTMDLDDELAGDCLTPVCPGDDPEPVLVPDDKDLPEDPGLACGAVTCANGTSSVVPLPAGTPCGKEPGVCDGVGTTEKTCVRCADTEEIPGNVGKEDSHARSTTVVSSGTYYWEIRAVLGDPKVNDGGLGLLNPEMSADDPWIGFSATGVSFGYASNPTWWSEWKKVSFPSGDPPEGSYVTKGWTYMFALDMDNGELWVGHEGVWYNGGDPEKGLNPAVTGIPGRIHAGVTLYDRHTNAFQANFMGPFQFPVPAGFRPGLF